MTDKFAPTLEGPYFSGPHVHHQGKFGPGGLHDPSKHSHEHHHHHEHHASSHHAQHDTTQQAIGGKTTVQQHVLQKRSPDGTTGLVPAEDQQNDSLYLAPVSIGTPAQTLYLDFDSGSSDLWVWSTELPAATQAQATGPTHAVFNSKKSSTYKAQTGSTWNISYGDGSSASGDVGTDNVTLGGITIKNQAVELAKTMSSSFVSGAGSGLLGLAWGSINTVAPTPVATPVANMITQADIPKTAELFTAYLGSWRDASEPDKGESFYTFGYIDPAVLTAAGVAAPSYAPVDNSQGFWQFASASYSINGKTTAVAGNTAIADTGTTLALVSDAVVKAIYAAIPGSKYDSSQQGYVFPTSVTAAQLPTVSFAVGNNLFYVQKEALAFADAGTGYVYGGIQSRGSNPFDILGDVFLKGVYAVSL
jgi:hypothetical protein